MNETDLRDCFAMFALVGLAMKIVNGEVNPAKCYEVADQMLEARNTDEELGIAALKPKRKYARKET